MCRGWSFHITAIESANGYSQWIFYIEKVVQTILPIFQKQGRTMPKTTILEALRKDQFEEELKSAAFSLTDGIRRNTTGAPS